MITVPMMISRIGIFRSKSILYYYFRALTILYTIYYIYRVTSSLSQGITYIIVSRIRIFNIETGITYYSIFRIFGNLIYLILQYANASV